MQLISFGGVGYEGMVHLAPPSVFNEELKQFDQHVD